MNHISPLRYGFSIASVVLVAAFYFLLHPFGVRLLSPPPQSYVPIAIITALVVAVFNSMTWLSGIPSRLVRRLGTIFLLALTLYALGEGGRGLYARSAFDGTLATHNEEWLALNSDESSITLTNVQRNRTLSLAAQKEAAAAVSGFSTCVTLAIETAPSGAERIAAGRGVIVPTDIKRCGGSITAQSTAPMPFAATESRQQFGTQADEAYGAGEDELYDSESGDVSFKFGEPMIDPNPEN